MRQRVLCSLIAVTTLMSVSLPVSAHLVGSHEFGIVYGLIHLFTEPAHLLLMIPALVVVIFYGFRATRQWWKKL